MARRIDVPGLVSGLVPETKLYLTDKTTADVSTTRHGLTPKLPNDATQFLNGTGAYSIPTGTGSGVATYESAYGSPPGSPNAGDIWYITDSMLHARYNGSAWKYYYGTQAVTKPVISDFATWFNQSTTTLTDRGQLTLLTPVGSTNYIRGKVLSAPGSLPYTVNMILISGAVNAAYVGSGFCWSDGTKYIMFGIDNISAYGLTLTKWNTTSSYNSSGTPLSFSPFSTTAHVPLYLRVVEDSTNRTCYYSLDGGNNFHQVYQETRTTFLTATQIGIMTYRDNATYEVSMSLLSWAVT